MPEPAEKPSLHSYDIERMQKERLCTVCVFTFIFMFLVYVCMFTSVCMFALSLMMLSISRSTV